MPTTITSLPCASKTTMTFTAADGIYRLSPDACEIDIIDQLDARQTQLEAMLAMTYCEHSEKFRSMNAATQEAFMWACSAAAREIKQLTELLWEMRSANKEDASS